MLLGEPCLGYTAPNQSEPWCLVREGHRWRILVRRALTRADKAYAIAVALAQWGVATGVVPTPPPPKIDDLAGRLLLPHAAVVRAHRAGLSAEEIASAFVCPLKLVATRMRDAAAERQRSGTFKRIREAG